MEASSHSLVWNRPNVGPMKVIFTIVDGWRVPFADYSDFDMQNSYYEDYTANVEVTNLLVFNLLG